MAKTDLDRRQLRTTRTERVELVQLFRKLVLEPGASAWIRSQVAACVRLQDQWTKELREYARKEAETKRRLLKSPGNKGLSTNDIFADVPPEQPWYAVPGTRRWKAMSKSDRLAVAAGMLVAHCLDQQFAKRLWFRGQAVRSNPDRVRYRMLMLPVIAVPLTVGAAFHYLAILKREWRLVPAESFAAKGAAAPGVPTALPALGGGRKSPSKKSGDTDCTKGWTRQQLINATKAHGDHGISGATFDRIRRRTNVPTSARGKRGRKYTVPQLSQLIAVAPTAVPERASQCVSAWQRLVDSSMHDDHQSVK
jgi:hypothetical protein